MHRPPFGGSAASRASVANDEYALQWQREPVACVQRLEEAADRIEVLAVSPAAVVDLTDCDPEIGYIVHHARLEEILEELVVRDSTTGLYLENEALTRRISLVERIGIEGLLRRTHLSEQNRHADLVGISLAGLDLESSRLQIRGQPGKHVVAREVVVMRDNVFMDCLESLDHKTAQTRRLC